LRCEFNLKKKQKKSIASVGMLGFEDSMPRFVAHMDTARLNKIVYGMRLITKNGHWLKIPFVFSLDLKRIFAAIYLFQYKLPVYFHREK